MLTFFPPLQDVQYYKRCAEAFAREQLESTLLTADCYSGGAFPPAKQD